MKIFLMCFVIAVFLAQITLCGGEIITRIKEKKKEQKK